MAAARVLVKVKELWIALPQSKDSCGDFDYFPDGGMKSFACHLDLAPNLPWLARASGLDVFRNGPHNSSELDLASASDFGHYNPAFVRWTVEHLVPAISDPAFRKRTQPTYDKLVRPLARIFKVTYDKFAKDPKCLEHEVSRFEELVSRRALPPGDYERYFFFMNAHFCANPDADFDFFSKRGFDGGHNGNVVKTCAAFWIRRTIDGTAADFYDGLNKLMAVYEPHAPQPAHAPSPAP